MNEMKKVFTFNYGGKELSIETGKMAKQADGAVLVSCEGTQVLVTACSSQKVKDGQDFFPLLVEYTEKFYSAGKFLGGFIKREARPTTQETLNARLIDRQLRPLFPDGYMFDTIISCTVISYSEKGDPEILAAIGASAALTISNIPFEESIGTCKVGRIDGKFVINPDHSQWKNSDLEIIVAGSHDAILMVEGEAKIVPEKEVLEAIFFGHDHIVGLVSFLKDIQKAVGKEKRQFVSSDTNDLLMNRVKESFSQQVKDSLEITDKMKRQESIRNIEALVVKDIEENPENYGLTEESNISKMAYKATDKMFYDLMRSNILNEEKRIGERGLNEVRPIETESNILHSPHGSALFTRGETQVLGVVTIGGSAGDQMNDRIVGQHYNKFYLHYNFPPYSVGEARGVRGVGRRELGHGNLAERALKALLPNEEEFPYTIRTVCEVLESNGSSSMGSVCAGSMALMDAGVPLKAPVAGVAMGLITDGKIFKILTDILGDEDHLGDMDFKIAGPKEGITAIQMDIKISGLSKEIVEKAMLQAREGRLHILEEMAKTIQEERKELKEGVPRVESFKIEPDKIGALIGPGGKNIKSLQETFQVTIEVVEDGTVRVIGLDKEQIKKCVDLAVLQIQGPKVGGYYKAKVVTIKEYGAFVDIANGVSGLVHISEISDTRINDINDYLSIGDMLDIKVIDVDRMGRVKLSAKQARPLEKK